MNKKEIEKIINESFNEDTPDFLSKIKFQCKNTKQIEPTSYVMVDEPKKRSSVFVRLAYGLLAAALFVAGIFIGGLEINPQAPNVEASITLDVNPSVEIKLDENNNVVDYSAINDDGASILENIELDGICFDTAVYAIVGAMYSNGYLTSDTNSILVSVDSKNDSVSLEHICEKINNVFKDNEEMQCSIIAQKVEMNDELKKSADEHNISNGKMQLISKIICNNDLYTEEQIDELVNMTIHELDLIYKSTKRDDNHHDEVITGKPGGFIEKTDIINQLLGNLNMSMGDIVKYDVTTIYHKNENNDRKMVYLVTINVASFKLSYIVDCKTGEIMPEETINDWKDKITNNDHFNGFFNDSFNPFDPK